MLQDLTTILPGVGLGKIRFGMTRDQIKFILGEPEEVDNFYLDDAKKCESESWYYDSKGLSLSFEAEEDWKLITIEVDEEGFTLQGNTVIGISKKELYVLLEELDITDLYEEATPMNETETHELVSSDSFEINFWLEENRVSEIQWGPLYSSEDTVNWPN